MVFTKILVNFGDDSGETFLNELQKYGNVDWVKANSLDDYVQKLKAYNYVIIGFHKSNDQKVNDFQLRTIAPAFDKEIMPTNIDKIKKLSASAFF